MPFFHSHRMPGRNSIEFSAAPALSCYLSTFATIPKGYGYISGTVLNGTGIPGVLVTTNTRNSTTTDTSGFYSLLVPAGAYNLIATKEPVFYPNSSVIVTAMSGTTVMQDIELTKKLMGTVSGTATRV